MRLKKTASGHQTEHRPQVRSHVVLLRRARPLPRARIARETGLHLYARTWQGEPLGEDAYVIGADEKSSIQARCRCRPTLAPGKARAMRVGPTYGRGGVLAHLATHDVHRAKV
ncbi:hypothetical protein OG786_09040 [Streptomyces sp. NBC_00101]|uniref:hypothetical protein n=1 Tax=Streptomyces sp. NBC_00101 TaxID=2975651 RepID=UPI003255E2D4